MSHRALRAATYDTLSFSFKLLPAHHASLLQCRFTFPLCGLQRRFGMECLVREISVIPLFDVLYQHSRPSGDDIPYRSRHNATNGIDVDLRALVGSILLLGPLLLPSDFLPVSLNHFPTSKSTQCSFPGRLKFTAALWKDSAWPCFFRIILQVFSSLHFRTRWPSSSIIQ